VLISYVPDSESEAVAIEIHGVSVLHPASQMPVPKTSVFANGELSITRVVCSRRETDRERLIPNSSGSQIRYLASKRCTCSHKDAVRNEIMPDRPATQI
jgi:hypothetical protein